MNALPQLPMPLARPRPCTRESAEFWALIVRMRKSGHRVRRVSGKQHLVDGRLLTAREVRQMANAIGAAA
jgi:hypothetical protein